MAQIVETDVHNNIQHMHAYARTVRRSPNINFGIRRKSSNHVMVIYIISNPMNDVGYVAGWMETIRYMHTKLIHAQTDESNANASTSLLYHFLRSTKFKI